VKTCASSPCEYTTGSSNGPYTFYAEATDASSNRNIGRTTPQTFYLPFSAPCTQPIADIDCTATAKPTTAAVDAETSSPSTTGKEYVDANGCRHICKPVAAQICPEAAKPSCATGSELVASKDSKGCTTYTCKAKQCPTKGTVEIDCDAKGKAYTASTWTGEDGCTYKCKKTCPTPVAPSCAKGTELYSYYDGTGCVVFGCKASAVEIAPEPKCSTPTETPCGKGYASYKYTDANGCAAYGCKASAEQVSASDVASSMADTSGDLYVKVMNTLGVYVKDYQKK
jgi:hypothetical protein